MHLKRITQFSAGNERSTTLTQSHSTVTRPARPQPPNLKARYNPIGVPNGPMGKIELGEDVEMAQAPPLPSSQATPGNQKGHQSVQTPKAEKKKKRKHATDEESPYSQPVANSQSGQKAKKARVGPSKSTSPPPKAATMTSTLPPHPGTNGASIAGLTSAQNTIRRDSDATTSSKELGNSSRKETPVPLPVKFRRLSQSQGTVGTDFKASLAKGAGKAVKKDHKSKKKGKGMDGVKREKSTTAPSKATPIPAPLPGGQRQP